MQSRPALKVNAGQIAFFLSVAALLTIIYAKLFVRMYSDWNAADSYYSHGFLIPPICLYIVWLKRKEFFAAPPSSSSLGYLLILGSMFFLVMEVFLGFAILGQITIVPMLFGLLLITCGWARAKTMWFPIAFLTVMIPIPSSITQSITFTLKAFAAEIAVKGAQLFQFPMTREGSYIHIGDDSLLVGDVCGGLRSLIALLATGALVAYFSRSSRKGQWATLLMSGPIAVAANVVRIFTLCIVAYYQGSEYAAGKFHDVSGILIFVVAFILFFMLEALLRKWLPPREKAEVSSA